MTRRTRSRQGIRLDLVALVLGSLVLLAPTGPIRAQSDSPDGLRVPPSQRPLGDGAGEASGTQRGPGLESLLELPSGFGSSRSRAAVAGASEQEWRRRFERSRKALSEARDKLAATKRELDSVVDEGGGSQWNVAPAIGGGGGGPAGGASPLSFKLRQELRRSREGVEQAEKALRQLRIEADLAGVPRSWWGPEDEASSTESREIPTR
ncbi:MAG TPA: hypothetical protein VKA74_19380 [Myxococcota bacterium]|nr:hypothetical protein [Myxococcota bacterium]